MIVKCHLYGIRWGVMWLNVLSRIWNIHSTGIKLHKTWNFSSNSLEYSQKFTKYFISFQVSVFIIIVNILFHFHFTVRKFCISQKIQKHSNILHILYILNKKVLYQFFNEILYFVFFGRFLINLPSFFILY